ncbi:MAG: hypothetical protein HAW61_02040, partial [Candidatus Portiera sp.]|nr:hypothetical protein [Portiera sp.]
MKISIKRTISGLTMTNPAMHIIKNIQALKAPTQLARLFGLLIITTALAACGGGGGTPAPIKEPPTPPATPQNLVAALSPDNVTITWTEVPDATFYNINRSGGADRANMRETDASHTDNSVIEGNEYTYMVSACNPSSCSNPTNLTVIYDVPAMPTSITATLSATGVNLQWPVVSGTGITHYNIARSGGADRADMRETDASHTDNSVIEGNEYTYMVSACNQVDCSPPASLMVDYSAPNTPMNLVASHSGNNVTITWTEVPDATYYNIARNGTFNNVNVTALTYTDTTVTQGMTYTYMVSACNHLGCSDANSTSIQLPLDTDGDGTPGTPMNLV